MPKCKWCGKEIFFIPTISGKLLPCEPRLITYYKGKGQKIVTKQGEVIECSYDGNTANALGQGYIPHWGNCNIKSKKKKPAIEEAKLF